MPGNSLPTRILLAEGNRWHVHLVHQALHELTHEVHVVGNIAEAHAAGLASFGLVLVGSQLEDGIGLDLVRELIAQPGMPPAVMLVDPDQRSEPGAALAAGAIDEVVVRPEFGMTLRRAVSRLLERSRLIDRIAELERRLEESTRFDAASGLYTERYFREVFERERQRIKRFGGTLAVLWLRGPHAAGIERTLGSHVRDHLLREIGALIQRDLRITDLAGRWTDGRFVVALTGTDRAGAQTVVERLAGHLADLESKLGLSAGLIPTPEILAVGGADELRNVPLD